jgi:hypothetical protein
MAFRSDVSVDYSVSPRIITVLAPSTQISVQDLHDTVTRIDGYPQNQSYPRLVLSAGKEDLGSGTLVGITSTYQDAQIAFQARTIVLQAGTATSADPTGKLLTDTAALFVTNGVQRGDYVANLDDMSFASVTKVVSETVLQIQKLVGGVENDWDIGENYRVYDVVQCEIDGGNAVAKDALDAVISSVFTTFGTQVVRTASSSATLQEQSAIQFSSFVGGVTVDVVNGTPGTEFPAGTPQQPVDNLVDALSILSSRGLTKVFLLEPTTITTGLDFTGITFIGQGEGNTTITVDAGSITDNTTYENLNLTGQIDTALAIRECRMNSLTIGDAIVHESIIAGPLALTGNAVVHLLDCWSDIPGATTPTIDMGGDGPPLTIRNYAGGIKLINKSGTDAVSIDMNSGQILLDATVTGGTIICRGVAKLLDSSVGATVVDELLDPTVVRVMTQILRNKLITDRDTGIMTLYDDDDITPLLTAPVYESTDTSVPYKGTGIQRRERLT